MQFNVNKQKYEAENIRNKEDCFQTHFSKVEIYNDQINSN